MDARYLADERLRWALAVEGNVKEAERCHRDGELVQGALLLLNNVTYLLALERRNEARAALQLARDYLTELAQRDQARAP